VRWIGCQTLPRSDSGHAARGRGERLALKA
jgi:hypothetical protein